jgi:hypothetical protein
MTPEEKELLLQDLCARLSYGVFLGCLVTGGILFPMYLGRNLYLEQYE